MSNGTESQELSGVTIRRLDAVDAPDVTRLVQLDSKGLPQGELLGAEIEGELVAVAPIDCGETIADPFSRTSELQALLELRAMQLRGRAAKRHRLAGLFARRGGTVARPSAPTPPGAGSLMTEPVRPS